MVRKIIKNGKNYYICEECLLAYDNKKWADKCENWCEAHKSCNLLITSHSNKLILEAK